MPGIDPSIPLQVRPQQAPDLLGQYGQVAQIQGMQRQQQLLPGQLQAQQLENQQRTIQLKQMSDTAAAYKSALVTNPDGSYDIDTPRLTQALAASGSGQAIPSVLEGVNKYREGIAKLQQTKAAVATAHADNGGAIGAAVKAAGYDPNLFSTLVDHGIQEGAIDPKGAAPYIKAVTDAMAQDPTGAQAKQIVQKLADTWIAQSSKQRELQTSADSAQARVLGANTGAARLNAELPGIEARNTQTQQVITGTTPVSPAQKLANDVAQANAARAAAALEETKRENAVRDKQGAARVGIAQQGVELRKKEVDPFGQYGINKNPVGGGAPAGGSATGDEFLKTLPTSMAATIKAMAEGREPAPSPGSRSPIAQQLNAALNQYDPGFTTERAQIRKAFTSGADGRNIGALNTATVHLDQLAEVAAGLKNGSFRPGNQLFNTFKTMFGSDAPTNFEGIKAAVSSEMASALKGNATDQEIASIKSTIDKSSSPEQLAGAVTTNLHILGAKLNTYQERYSQKIPSDKNWSPVLPTAKAVFDKHGINPTAGTSVQGGGQQITEGTVIVNPQTKQRMVLKAGQWVAQ